MAGRYTGLWRHHHFKLSYGKVWTASDVLSAPVWLSQCGVSLLYRGLCLQFLVTVGLVLLLVGVARQTDWRELGLKPLSARKMLRYGIVGGLALLAVIFVLSLPLEILNPDIEPQVYEEILRSAHGVSQLLLLLLMGAVLAPISEELFFRGMIYPLTRYSLGPFWGAIGAGIIFGLAHWDAWRAIPLAIGGAILCYLYEKSGSIWATVTAHGMWNGIMTLLVYFSLA